MAQSGSVKPPPSIDPIRQQLDELDALLQRMLKLPVNNAEGESATATRPVQTVPPPAELENEPEPEALPPLPPLPPPRTILSPPVREERPEPPPVRNPGPVDPPRIVNPIRHDPPHPQPRRPVWDTLPKPTLAPPSSGMKLLLRVNHLFDTGVGFLGPVGKWLRKPWGRTVIGWVGLLCLTAALAVFLFDWFGWSR